MSTDGAFRIDAADPSVQTLSPRDGSRRFEGVGFSPSGDALAVAAPDANEVLLFRRGPGGRFEESPSGALGGPRSGLDYPHDVSFSRFGAGELFAVAQRSGAISLYQRKGAGEEYGVEPVFRIDGPRARLDFSDGVAFVPPDERHLAACSLAANRVSFYRRTRRQPVRFETEPDFELEGGSLFQPDGLAFSRSGEWLAVANHGNDTVSIFRRRHGLLRPRVPRYGPEPAAILRGPELRYPHSLAFTPGTGHLVVTNAGANWFSVYGPAEAGWSGAPMLRHPVGPDRDFQRVNARNKKEGGPKGVAVHGNQLAVCSPEIGISIYRFRERGG